MVRWLLIVAGLAWASPGFADVQEGRALYLAGEHEAALAVIVPLAEAGDPVAENILGDAYDRGNGVPQDPDQALDWFTRAADRGFDKALHNLGHFHHRGRPGHPVDLDLAASFYGAAADQGYAHSMNNLGIMALEADDHTRAAAEFQRAADLGLAHAQQNLGDLYRQGLGVEEDANAAMGLYRLSAKQGHGPGINALGAMYEGGIGVEVDLTAALALYELALAGGEAQSAVNLAYLLAYEDQAYWFDPAYGLAHCYLAMRMAGDGRFDADCAQIEEDLGEEMQTEARDLAEDL